MRKGWIVGCAMLALAWVARGAEISLHIDGPDGKPAGGAIAAIVPAGRTVFVTDGLKLDDDPNYVLGKSDTAGNVTLKTDAADFLLLVVCPAGYARLDHDAALAAHRVMLTPWGRIEGELRRGAKVMANEPVHCWLQSEASTRGASVPGWCFESTGTTDAGGHFVLEHMPAGQCSVASNRTWWNFTTYPRPLVLVNVQGGQTARATLGGSGRTIVGKVNVPESVTKVDGWQFVYCVLAPVVDDPPSPMPERLKGRSLQEQAEWWRAFRGSATEGAYRAEQKKRYAVSWEHTHPFDVAPDGTFRIEDVAPGKYELSIGAMVPYRESHPGKDLGGTKIAVTVQPSRDERSDEPQVIPPIEWNQDQSPEIAIGQSAPEFAVPALGGGTIRLSDYRGKFVLLDFWATWCGPCVAEIPNLLEAHRTFAPSGKITFISLSLDDAPDAPIDFIKRQKIDWKQGFLGHWDDDPVSKSYGVGGIPSTWLIGPDGRVIARGLRGEEIAAEISKALGAIGSS